MKRFSLFFTIVFLTAIFATHSFAQNANSGSCGVDCGQNGRGMMSGHNNQFKNNQNSELVKTADEAKKIVQNYVNENLKGYKVGNVSTYTMRMGNMYQVEAVDASGNAFYFHVSPYGYVRGPMPVNVGAPRTAPKK